MPGYQSLLRSSGCIIMLKNKKNCLNCVIGIISTPEQKLPKVEKLPSWGDYVGGFQFSELRSSCG